jgi:hypothetical protein
MFENVVFEEVRVVGGNAGEAGFQKGHQGIVGKVVTGNGEEGPGELKEGVVGHRAAAIDEVGEVVLSEAGFDVVLIEVESADKNSDVAQPMTGGQEVQDGSGDVIDFGAEGGGDGEAGILVIL